MLQRTPLFMAVAPQIVGSGVQPDLHDLQQLLWADAENVVFYNGKVRRREGPSLAFSAGVEPIRGLLQKQDSAGIRWLYAASGGDLKRWYGPAAENVLLAQTWTEDQTSIANATFWDLVPYGDWVLINTGIGALRVFKPGTGVETITDAPSDIVTIGKKFNFVLAIGYGAAKTRMGWSDADNIDDWTATASNLAGSLSAEDFNTPIRAAADLGQNIAVYGEDQMGVLRYVGAPFYFGFQMALDGIGAIGKEAVVADGAYNYGVSRNGVWGTDGLTFRYIDEGAVGDYFQEAVNWDQGSKIIAARNDVTRCIEFTFPMIGGGYEGWSFDSRNGAWSQVPAFSMKDERKLLSRPIGGGFNGDVYLDQSDAGSMDNLVLETKPLLMQLQSEDGLRDTHNESNIHETDLMLKSASKIEFALGSSHKVDGNWTWTNWIAAQPGAVTYPTPAGHPAGTYHKLKFRNVPDNWDWTFNLQGFGLFGKVEGTKRAS